VHGSVPVLIGGTSDKAVGRVATWGAGWTAGGGGPEMAAPVVEKVRAAWRDAGRDGEPRLAALAYFSLGDDAAPDSRAYLLDYYSYAGKYAEAIASSALRTPTQIRDAVRAFADLGFSELYLDPTTAALDQVDRLADVVL
jgi:alkanesulfonate monooxygenase SsuD/methylene tetrahydromethanopterin reductase-like flavin-dependent oxidoreductase (luciferase family)